LFSIASGCEEQIRLSWCLITQTKNSVIRSEVGEHKQYAEGTGATRIDNLELEAHDSGAFDQL